MSHRADPARGQERPCPICGKAATDRFRPFCSKRCADVDLGRWFGEVYRVRPVEPDEQDDAGGLPQDDADSPG